MNSLKLSQTSDTDYLRSLAILYVEDEADLRLQMGQFLKRHCGKVYIACDGQSGIEMFRKQQPDIVITDILMPVMDGLAMTEQIKAESPATPIIITTAFEESRYFHRAFDLCVNQYINKPIDLQRLKKLLIKCAHTLRAELALRETEQRYHLLFKFSRIAIVVCKANHDMATTDDGFQCRIDDCNQAFLKMISLDNPTIVEQSNLSEFISVQSFELFKDKILPQLVSQDYSHEFEIELVRPDGSTIPVVAQTFLRKEEGGRPQEIWTVMLDISERVKIELQLREYQDHLQELVYQRTRQVEKARLQAEYANHAKTVFLANMSHELRTPLIAILGFAQLLEQDSCLSQQQRQNFHLIKQNGQHLLSLINDLLDISRFEAEPCQSVHDAFDLKHALELVEKMVAVRALDKGLEFKYDCPHQLPELVVGDERHLRQVLLNLLGNAVKYTDSGEIGLSIQQLKDKEFSFTVSDSGQGIAIAEQQRIFQAFYQTNGSVTHGEGMGLGLSISQKLIQLMGGELKLKSELGRGSHFSFTLTLPGIETETNETIHSGMAVLAKNQPAPRIIVLEADDEVHLLLKQMLETIGCRVCVLSNVEEFKLKYQYFQPQLILINIYMKDESGQYLGRSIRKLPTCKNLPIIALTASTFEEGQELVMSAGCDEIMLKPVEQQTLLEMICRRLDLKPQYGEVEQQPEQRRVDNLTALPIKLVEQLAELASMLELELIEEIVEKIASEYPAEASLISSLIKQYRFDKLLQLCHKT